MIIDKKIVYARKKEEFESLIPTIPEGLNPVVFIEDTREMWTCGTYFSIGYPSIEVSEVSGSVKVQIGNSFFLLTPTGDSISLRKGDGNRIIISSNALNRVDTEPPLKWDASNRKLLHMESGVASGSYGQSTNLGNASVFVVPNFIVDATGHITFAENHNIEIRDYVEQVAPSNQMAERNILLSYNEANNNMDTSQVRKANGLTFNDATQRITVAGGMVSDGAVTVNHGDVSVLDGYIIGKLKGDVEGQATPKIHLSLKPEYGGASTKLYGHVKLQDILSRKPDPSSDNENINDTNVVAAIAASPLMVWNAIETAKSYADSILGSNNAMLFKGALEAGISSPGTYTPMADVGNTYVVTFGNGAYRDSVGYINGVSVEVGDLLICKEATAASDGTNWEEVSKKWTYVQTNTTGVVSGPSSATIGQLAVFDSITGKLIKGLPNGSVGQMLVINESGIPTWANKPDRLNHALSFQVKGVEFTSFDGYEAKKVNFIAGDNMFITPDNQGNLTLAADPGNNTENTAGATDLINTKLFLIGAESQTESPQTYSNRYVYVGADNCLYSDGKKVSTTDHTHPIYVTLDTEQTINGSKTFTTPIISTVASGTAPLVVASNTLVSNLNADLLDGLHENSFLRHRDTYGIDGYNTLWAQIGIRQYNDAKPDGMANPIYNYGAVISLPGANTRLDIWYNHTSSASDSITNGIQYRSGFNGDKKPWRMLLDSVNYASYSDGRYVKKAGDTMTGTLGMGANTIYWKENGFGAKFGLTPYFSGTNDNNYLAFMSSVGEAGTDPAMSAKMVLTGLGNVGIGTTTPTQKLHVIGGGLFTALLTTTGITNNGTLTQNGDIIINQASTTGTRQVRFQGGDNDYGRVAYGGTASNAGWMEIASCNDGNEPIYARQYTGVFTTVKRTATLLDANGNTVFPGTVTAPTFTGALNGTAEWSKRLATNSQLTFGLNGLTYFNANLGAGTAANQNVGPTAQWWHILRMNHGNGSGYFADIAVPLNTSDGIYWRRIQGGTNYGWYRVLDTNNYAGIIDGRYVNVTGDTMTGALHLANGTRNNAGDDCGFGDCNIGGCLGLQGLNGATGLAFIQQGASWSGGNNYRFTWNGSNMTSSSTAQWNNLNADLLDGYHQAAFSMGWTTSTKYRVDRWGGSTDKNWKKIVTYVCTGGGQHQSCKVKGTIYYITGNHNQGHVIDIPFEAIMYAYGGTANSMLNQSYLYLPPYCTWDMIRIVRYNNNSWEVQVRQPSDWTNISLEYTVTNNGGSVSAGQFINTSYSSTVANNYNTNVSRPTSSYANRAASADRLTTARSINGTNFDGTANITTSYWGTARNFTIGNTTRSVNGSGNVTWSFADIGSAPASHSHNYINSRGNLNPQTGRTQNLGNVYSYNTVSGTSNGAPTTYTSVIGFGRSTGGTVEIAGGWTAGMGLWYRALRDTTDNWYGWVKVWDTKNFDPNSKANSNHNHDGSYITKGGSNNNVVLGAGGYRALSDFTLNSNWAASKDASGYVKFPNGFIIQWGEAYVGANSTGHKSFPIAFPTACISVQVTHKTTATNWDKVCVAGNYTRTSCTIANGETVNSMINWMALGY